MAQVVSFEAFLEPAKWYTFEKHAAEMDRQMEEDVARITCQNRTLKNELRKMLVTEFSVKTVTSEQREWARRVLFSGDVCAVDGTRSLYPLLSGVRCRIGVVAVSYRGHRTESAIFVSEQHVDPPEANALSILRRRKTEMSVVSSMVVGAIMAYMERSIALGRTEAWKLLNGPLIPYELRTGLGELRALGPCLDLSGRIIEDKRIAGVIGTSSHLDIVSVGLALEPGEYVCLHPLKADLEEYLYGSPDTGVGARSPAKFSEGDRRLFEEFISNYGTKVDVGLLRAGSRPYVFHAHHELFDKIAAILITDAEIQPLRAYPLLVDYADALCTRLFAGSDFRRQMEMKLSKSGAFEIELPEQFFRRR